MYILQLMITNHRPWPPRCGGSAPSISTTQSGRTSRTPNTCIYIYIYAYCICMYVYMYVCIYIYIYIYTYVLITVIDYVLNVSFIVRYY